jgi:hypothetical protein
MTPPTRLPPAGDSSRRVVQAARMVRAAKRAWDGRLPPPGRRVPGQPTATRPSRVEAGTIRPAAARRPATGPARQVPRVGRIAARVAWVLATLGLVAVAAVELGSAVRAVVDLPGHGGAGTVAGTVVLASALALAGLLALDCAPSCAPRVLGRRRGPGRSRLPRVLLAAEVTARVVAGACLLGAALESHESTHLWFTRGDSTGPLLARIAVHPITLIATGVAAAAVSRRWSRLAHAARSAISRGGGSGRSGQSGEVSRSGPRSAGRST